MPPPELNKLLGRARELTKQYLDGGTASFGAFRELIQFLLDLTVIPPAGAVKAEIGPRKKRDRAVISGRLADGVVPLLDGKFLKIVLEAYLDPEDGEKLKVAKSVYQYQADEAGDRWIVRYEYLRHPADPHPAMHLHVRGTLTEAGALPEDTPLERIHFPTDRVSIEAVIRLLVDQFKVETRTQPEVWRAVFAETEAAFLEIARRGLSGPDK